MTTNTILNEQSLQKRNRLRSFPFSPWPHFEPDEIEAAVHVLESGKINYKTGDEGHRFEKEFAAYTGCKHAIAVANGTVALELALYGLGIGVGDEVVVPSRTFIASASCVVMRGAIPVVAEVDALSQNINADTIRPLLTSRTKAIIAVHLAGWPCDMDSILALAHERGINVIEDCAQAHGATYKGRPVGSLGDAAAFSFCQDKIMTTGGEGGMLTTNDESVAEHAKSFRDHGTHRTSVSKDQQLSGFRWIHDTFGTNWRLTEMQSAIGRVQLRKLPQWVAARRRNATLLTKRLADCPGLRVTAPPKEMGHSYYKYYAFVRPEELRTGQNRDRIIASIHAEGIPCFSGICSEIYLEKAFPEKLRPKHRLPIARRLGETSMMFLVHPTLSEQDMLDTSCAIENVMRSASR